MLITEQIAVALAGTDAHSWLDPMSDKRYDWKQTDLGWYCLVSIGNDVLPNESFFMPVRAAAAFTQFPWRDQPFCPVAVDAEGNAKHVPFVDVPGVQRAVRSLVDGAVLPIPDSIWAHPDPSRVWAYVVIGINTKGRVVYFTGDRNGSMDISDWISTGFKRIF